jgi:hypothetical protein
MRLEWRFRSLLDVALSFLLKETASLFNLSTHSFAPVPNPYNVMAAGRHPIAGSVVTPILLAPNAYRLRHKCFLIYQLNAYKFCLFFLNSNKY